MPGPWPVVPYILSHTVGAGCQPEATPCYDPPTPPPAATGLAGALLDVFFVLAGGDGSGRVVLHGSAVGLLERLQQLPGFDNSAVIKAMGSTEEAVLVCWRPAGGKG